MQILSDYILFFKSIAQIGYLYLFEVLHYNITGWLLIIKLLSSVNSC